MNADQRKELIPELDSFLRQADALKRSLDSSIEEHRLFADTSAEGAEVMKAVNTAHKLVSSLRHASDTLKEANSDEIKTYVTGWYHLLHFDMHPVVEIAEKDVVDPDYEMVSYQGDDTWEIIMTTPTHGCERVVVHSDTATWDRVYSAVPCSEGQSNE